MLWSKTRGASPMPWKCARLRLSRAMGYTFHRIFCATPGDLEAERDAFHTVLAEFDEAEAMPRDILLVPVTVTPNMYDLEYYRAAIDENVRAVRYYVQVLSDTWGRPPRSFEHAFGTATQALEDPRIPLKEIVVLFKAQPPERAVDAGITWLKAELAAGAGPRSFEFGDLETYKQVLRGLLGEWLETIAPRESGGAGGDR